MGGLLKGLRDNEGRILLQFSKEIGTDPPLLIELYAVKYGTYKFHRSNWKDKYRVIIVKLLLNGREYSGDFITEKGMTIRYIPQVCNIESDELAKTELILVGAGVLYFSLGNVYCSCTRRTLVIMS
ncbi:hypothetical protein V6N13_039739 [Hibiscus sabdariffa]|uniref:Uncharacterized protein n=1 Tax=Hibiscus sabdariffa TaxID=183260 RepID=A0ABR2SUL2_9ROSI